MAVDWRRRMEEAKRKDAMNLILERQRRARVAEKWVRRILQRDGPSTVNHLQQEVRKIRPDIRKVEIRGAVAAKSFESIGNGYTIAGLMSRGDRAITPKPTTGTDTDPSRDVLEYRRARQGRIVHSTDCVRYRIIGRGRDQYGIEFVDLAQDVGPSVPPRGQLFERPATQ